MESGWEHGASPFFKDQRLFETHTFDVSSPLSRLIEPVYQFDQQGDLQAITFKEITSFFDEETEMEKNNIRRWVLQWFVETNDAMSYQDFRAETQDYIDNFNLRTFQENQMCLKQA
jgi:hypothetical protein